MLYDDFFIHFYPRLFSENLANKSLIATSSFLISSFDVLLDFRYFCPGLRVFTSSVSLTIGLTKYSVIKKLRSNEKTTAAMMDMMAGMIALFDLSRKNEASFYKTFWFSVISSSTAFLVERND